MAGQFAQHPRPADLGMFQIVQQLSAQTLGAGGERFPLAHIDRQQDVGGEIANGFVDTRMQGQALRNRQIERELFVIGPVGEGFGKRSRQQRSRR